MSRKYFGTDGVRGKVGTFPITPQFVMQLGYAAGKVLAGAAHARGERPGVLIGKDTRISGYMLESALEAGLIAAGIDVYLAGPVPTPAVAYLTRALPSHSDSLVCIGSSIAASIANSTSSGNFVPAPEKNLMPLSSKGLCEAEITTPACKRKARVK